MQFDGNDDAYFDRRDELGQQFASWLIGNQLWDIDPNDAGMLMDWKVNYADGALDRWTLADAEEFLLDWCPRKLSAPADIWPRIPPAVAAFVDFLAATGLLSSRSEPPQKIRRHCAKITSQFIREMGNTANFGMAKSLLAGSGLSPDFDEAELAEVMQSLTGDSDDSDPPQVGPVRLPDEPAQKSAAQEAAALVQIRALAAYCAPAGRPLTQTGNLRLADARHLVAALQTGDDVDFGGQRKLQSAADLPVLDWLFLVALEAGAVRRKQGKLVAVARFAALSDLDAFRKVVRAALSIGLTGTGSGYFTMLEPARWAADQCVVGWLAALLGPEGMALHDVVALACDLIVSMSGPLPEFFADLPKTWVGRQIEYLTSLNVITVDDEGVVTLTDAGIVVAVELAEDAGFDVLVRQDPESADAAAMVEALLDLPSDTWAADAVTWLAHQPDRARALDELVTAGCAVGKQSAVVILSLQAIGDLVGDDAIPAVRRQLEGPRDGIVLNWLDQRDAIDLATVDPMRLVAGFVDVLSSTFTLDGPVATASLFDHGADEAAQLELLDRIWRLEHPGLADVLQAVGAHHPTKAVAKAARKAALRHNSWLANAVSRR